MRNILVLHYVLYDFKTLGLEFLGKELSNSKLDLVSRFSIMFVISLHVKKKLGKTGKLYESKNRFWTDGWRRPASAQPVSGQRNICICISFIKKNHLNIILSFMLL